MPWLARLLEGHSLPQPRLDGGSRAQRGRSEAAISFSQIHKQSGQPRENQKVVLSVGVVENADITKGYEVSDDTYLPPRARGDRRRRPAAQNPHAGPSSSRASRPRSPMVGVIQ
jgi:hypothetical protein